MNKKKNYLQNRLIFVFNWYINIKIYLKAANLVRFYTKIIQLLSRSSTNDMFSQTKVAITIQMSSKHLFICIFIQSAIIVT